MFKALVSSYPLLVFKRIEMNWKMATEDVYYETKFEIYGS